MAQAMIHTLGDDWDAYARKWIEINAKYPQTRTAAAIDNAGYWYVNQKWAAGSHTHAARTLSSYEANKPEGTVMGVYRNGYEWEGEVYRPAQVKVARSPRG